MYTFGLIYRRHVTASVCDIASLIWSGCFYSQLVENRRSLPTPNFWRKWHLPCSCPVAWCFAWVFFALLNNGWTTDYPCKVERLETTLHQLKISLFWPLKMLGINSLPGFVYFYRKGFHLLCRRKPVKNPTVTTRSWDHCGRDGAFALRSHEGLVEFWATMWCGSARFLGKMRTPRPFQIFCLPHNLQLLDIAIAQQQKLPSQLVGVILRVCGYKKWD